MAFEFPSFADARPVKTGDVLRINGILIDTADTITVNYIQQFADPKKPGEWLYKLARRSFALTVGVLLSDTIPLYEGWLVSVNVSPQGSTHQVGNLFIDVTIERAGDTYAVLISDYCDFWTGASWPQINSKQNTDQWARALIQPANPAAGANLSYAVPVHTILQPISFRVRLTTPAGAAGNRTVAFAIRSGGQVQVYLNSPIVTPDNTSKDYYWSGVPVRDNTIASVVSVADGVYCYAVISA